MKDFRDKLYIATVCDKHEEIIDKYNIGVELDQFCQPDKMDNPIDEDVLSEVESLVTSAGKCTFHATFSEIYPAAIDPKARALAMERLHQAGDLAVKYGADKMIVHSGYVPLVYFKEWHEDRSVEFWEEFIAARNDDLKIVIENVMDDEPYMMAKMMERITHPNIKMCFDVGHAACISKVDVLEWIEVLAPYIGHLHIHNNDGSHDWHKPIFEGRVDMEAFLAKVEEKCASDTTITIESLDAMSSMEWLEEKGYI